MTNEVMFREKLKLLNEDFVDFVSAAIQENPSYDLTPSVTDYLHHVKDLDKLYATPKPVERKIIVAKRKNTPAAPKVAEKAKETPPAPATVPEPKKLSNGLVEPVGQFGFAPKIQMPEIPSLNKTPVFSAPKVVQDTPSSTSLTQNRKRRQEPLDYDKMREQSSNDFMSEKAKDSPPPKDETIKNSEPAAPFSTKPSLFNNGATAAAPSLLSFGNSPATLPQPNKSSNGLEAGGLFTNSWMNKTPLFPTLPPSNKKDGEEKGATGDAVPSSKNDESGSTVSTKPLFSFGGAPGSSPFTFGGKGPAPGSSLFSFVNSTANLPQPNKSSNGLEPGGLFAFGSKAQAPWIPSLNTTPSLLPVAPAEKKDGEEEGDAAEDAPPPKVEIVKHDEPDAVISTKCSLFNFVSGEYKKVGVGFLHIKKTDAGTQLLIRAATSLGTVLVNTYIKETFKAEKKDKDKIQFSYPSAEGPKTHLIRIIEKMDDVLAYLTGEKKP